MIFEVAASYRLWAPVAVLATMKADVLAAAGSVVGANWTTAHLAAGGRRSEWGRSRSGSGGGSAGAAHAGAAHAGAERARAQPRTPGGSRSGRGERRRPPVRR